MCKGLIKKTLGCLEMERSTQTKTSLFIQWRHLKMVRVISKMYNDFLYVSSMQFSRYAIYCKLYKKKTHRKKILIIYVPKMYSHSSAFSSRMSILCHFLSAQVFFEILVETKEAEADAFSYYVVYLYITILKWKMLTFCFCSYYKARHEHFRWRSLGINSVVICTMSFSL